jgi:D-glycero-D-manno-heptose 1,7-bisphosphate phosphatase
LNKAVFLDRDGVLNYNREDYVKTVSELKLLPNIINPIKKLKENNFLIIVITNQSAINRGLTTIEEVQKINTSIQNSLEDHGTLIDKFYVCPHTPSENCDCRKPKIGLLLRAASDFQISLNLSWVIGDNDSDIKAGISAGCKTIKINNEIDLAKAAKIILKNA